MIFKKQIGIVVTVVFSATTFSFAQSYSLVPNDTINIAGMLEDLETLTIQQQNITTDTIQLKWKKINESVPDLWEASVCDNAICYATLQDSGTMNPIYPADYGFVLLHITPHVNYGTAIIRYEVWDIKTPLLRDTLTYILTVNATAKISTFSQGEDIGVKIFPNPSKENFIITTILQNCFQYSITDATGKEIEKGISNSSIQNISTDKWKNGYYTISILNNNKIISNKKIIIQQ